MYIENTLKIQGIIYVVSANNGRIEESSGENCQELAEF